MTERPPHTFRETDVSLRDYAELLVGGSDHHLRALAALFDQKLGGLKEYALAELQTLRATIDERAAQYNERATTAKTAVDAALKSAETLTNAAFAASEKAIVKSDVNAEKWRENANEWRAAMMDRETRFASRSEMDTELKNLRSDLQGLKEGQAAGKGAHQQQADNKTFITTAVAILVVLVTLATFFLKTSTAPAPAPQVIYVPAAPHTLLPSTPPQPVPR